MTERKIYSTVESIPPNWELPLTGIKLKDLTAALEVIATGDPNYRFYHYVHLGVIASSLGKFDFVDKLAETMKEDKTAQPLLHSREEEVEGLYLSAAAYAVFIGKEKIGKSYADRIQNPVLKELAHGSIAEAAAERGRLTYAYSHALMGPKDYLTEGDTFNPLVKEIARRGKYDLARRVARKAVGDDTYDYLLTVIVKEAVNNDGVDEAQELVDSIRRDDYKADAYISIAKATRDMELLNKATELAWRVLDGNVREELLFEIYEAKRKLSNQL